MNTRAAIFLLDDKTKLFNGVTVKFDGYIKDGVGYLLHHVWAFNKKELRSLCIGNRYRVRTFGPALKYCTWLKNDKHIDDYRNLTMEELKAISEPFDFVYIFMNDVWYVLDEEDDLALLKDYL